MKRISFIFSLLLIFSSHTFAQWDSLENGIKGHSKFQTNSDVIAQAVYNGNLYFGGLYDTVGGLADSGLAMWNGISWGVNSNQKIIGGIYTLTRFNGNLVGGGIDSIGGIAFNNIAVWNGTNWSNLGSGLPGWIVETMVVYNGNLYVGGISPRYGYNNIAMWNGATWSQVGSGVYNTGLSKTLKTGGAIYALSVYNGKLYVGGKFDSAGGVAASNIAGWDGSNWSNVGGGFMDSTIGALTVFNNELYAGGFLGSNTKFSGVIDKWNGSSWSPVGSGRTGKLFGYIDAMVVYDSSVCVAGQFDSIGGINAYNIAYWNGSSWGTFGTGINGPVFTVEVYNSELYAGGSFSQADNIHANNVARWSGPLGVPEISEKMNISVFPNPNIGRLIIKMENISDKSYIEIYNVLGEKVLKQILCFNQDDNVIDLSNNPNGVYLYRILTDSGKVISDGKFIIQK